MRRRAAAIAAILLALTSLSGLIWTGTLFPPDPQVVTGVDAGVLEQALHADPSLPLRAGETDVVLIVACTLRRDRLEPYGQARPTSPFLSRLADAGVRFDEHFSQAPWTRPSVGTLETGRWPRTLQLDNPGRKGSLSLVLGQQHTTLGEAFAAAGYRTYGATGNPNVKRMFGFDQGYQEYDEPEATWHDGGGSGDDADLVDGLLAFADSLGADERLFARLVLTSTHLPRQYARRDLGLFSGPDAMVERYDASVRHLDRQLARLFTALRLRRPNLLFVVAADHGEGLRLPEHHGPGHGRHLYQSALRVPLLLHHPALPAGHVVRGLSMNIDVHPTLLDLLGLPLDHAVDGASQAEAARGGRASHPAAFAESFYLNVRKAAVFDGAHHLVRNRKRGADMLFAYDDPAAVQETADPAAKARLAALLDAWEAQMDAAGAGQGQSVELDDATREQLEAMGYVE